jgi:ferredoxin
MKIKSLKLVCFSPTGTTRTVIQSIARGIPHNTAELVDVTRPETRNYRLQTHEKELLIVAIPVYMGRVPALLSEWLHSIRAYNTPAVCVVVYGNRAYEDALLELKDVLTSRGCIPIAGAAFIGEHSFSSAGTPTAEGRPDAVDMQHAELFGRKIYDKLQSVSTGNHFPGIEVPGNYPYGGITQLWSVDFIAVNNKCIHCGICAQSCPVGAIDAGNSNRIDTKKCITCCACIKICQQKARTMKTGLVSDAATRLNKLYKDRKEPVLFL